MTLELFAKMFVFVERLVRITAVMRNPLGHCQIGSASRSTAAGNTSLPALYQSTMVGSDGVRRRQGELFWTWFAGPQAMKFERRCSLSVLLLGCFVLVGCSRPSVPQTYEPSKSAELALTAYDTDQDGKIAGPELDDSPALKAALERMDTDQDGALTADEISDRLSAYKAMSKYIVSELQIRQRGKPVAGAELVVELESFMGQGLPSFKGTTNPGGTVVPESDSTNSLGLPLGLYKIEVTSQGEKTIFGAEFADDVTDVSQMSFDIE